MGDNDFPTVMANGGNTFLSGYMKRKGFYGEEGTDIPGGSVSYETEQELGKPMTGEVQIAGSPGYFRTEKDINDILWKYGMNNTTTGAEIKERIRKLQQMLNLRGV